MQWGQVLLSWLRRLTLCMILCGWVLAAPAQAPDTVTNSATVNPPTGVHDPDCGQPGPADCAGNNGSSTSAQLWVDAVTKSAEPASGTSVQAGQTITYTLTITVANAPTTAPIVLQDQLGAGLVFGSVVSAGPFVAGGSGSTRSFALPAGTPVGVHAVRYTATVADGASGKVSNVVSAPGCAAGSCSTTHPLGGVVVAKRLSSESGTQSGLAEFAETLGYTVTLTNGDAAPVANYRFTENVPAGATLVGVDGAAGFSSPVPGPAAVPLLVAQVPANGIATVGVRFRIADSPPAGQTEIVNRIDGGDIDTTICRARCIVTTPLEQPTAMRLVKSVAVREAHVGDLLRYTLRVANAGAVDITDGRVLDTPPPGFSYVAGSMTVADRDGAFTLGSTQTPLQIGGLDIATGQEAVITYLLRVGAGVRQGVYTNQAQAVDRRGWPISNVATAQVKVVADPLLDESLILGTVFDDRDGDGWQAPASLTGVRVQGGFAPEAYVAGSTEIDRGQGFVALLDDSVPLLKGLALGRIAGRETEADAPANHQIVLRQRLRALDFRDGFVLRSAQGVSLHMDAAGATRIEREGDAAQGLNGALPGVERRVAVGEGGYVVDYVLRNLGVDERGIPGVRVASAEGLLMETDAFGRYHLLGIDGGAQAFGRNFVLKVDPATLPADAEFSTPNPLVRRITPGVPVRFDFGVRLPVRRQGSAPAPADIVLGEALFEAGKASPDPAHAAVLNELAARLQAQGGGGELVLLVRDDADQALALARAHALRAALLPRLQTAARAVRVVLRPADGGTPLAAQVQGGVVLGAMVFETGQAALRPGAAPLLHALAQQLEQDGGGRVEIAQDPGGTPADLAMARARAVYAALAAELPAAARGRLEVAP